MDSEDDENLMDWLTRCEAIAESDSYLQIGHPEDQVIVLKATLLQAATAGVNWREIYRSIYEKWHSRRPHFPDLNAMAAEIEHYGSRSKKPYWRFFLPGRTRLSRLCLRLPHWA